MRVFQSTLPREERQIYGNDLLFYLNISIHAPTRGATFPCLPIFRPHDIFQSTLPREERRYSSMTLIASSAISIHAPTRGATSLSHGRLHPVPPFQSTLPREERPGSAACLISSVYFNPRSHERSDQDRQILFGQLYEFQSTLPREERHLVANVCLNTCIISIHAPTRGATLLFLCQCRSRMNFNPRSHERSDTPAPKYRKYYDKISIHAPTRGATYHSHRGNSAHQISIHAPTRGATDSIS